MVTGGWVTQADRARWRAQAVRELAAVLDAPGDLSGRISGLAPAA
jgi:hypothetical protein